MYAYLQSESFGLFLKCVTAISAFGFGAYGVGAETRDKSSGRLNHKGWTALIGMAVAGVFAIIAAVNDYSQDQAKSKATAAKDRKIQDLNHDLLVNSRRVLYPFSGVTLDATLRLSKSAKIVADYTKRLDAAIAKDPECSRTEAFECVAMGSMGEVYEVSETSPLYPKLGTPLRAGLESLGLAVELLKQTPSAGAAPTSFKKLGAFELRFSEYRTGEQSIRYVVANDQIALMINGYEIKDAILFESKVASLVDFMPGALAAGAEVNTNSFFHGLAQLNYDIPATIKTFTPFQEAVTLDRIKFRFPYPITVSVGKPYSVECGNDYLARLLPADPDATQNYSGLGVPALTLPDADQQRLCSSLVSLDNKSVNKPKVKKPDPELPE